MKNFYSLICIFVVTAFFAFTSPVFAEGAYVGGSVGIVDYDICASGGGVTCDDSDTGFKVFGGMNINETFSLEVSYVDLGEVAVSAGSYKGAIEVDAVSIDGIASIPVNDKFDVFGKLGVTNWAWDYNENYQLIGEGSDHGLGFKAGAGFKVDLQDNVGLRVELEYYDIDGDDALFLSGGIVIGL